MQREGLRRTEFRIGRKTRWFLEAAERPILNSVRLSPIYASALDFCTNSPDRLRYEQGSNSNGLEMKFGAFTLSVVATFLICLALGLWLGPPLPLSPSPRRLAEERIWQALEEPSALDVQNVRLRDVLRQLASRHKIRFLLDRSSLRDVGASGNELVTRKVSGIRLRYLLHSVLRKFELTFCVHDGAVVITTRDSTRGPQYQVGAVYPMPPPAIGSRSSGEDTIAGLIRTEVTPSDWSWLGGRCEMHVIPGALVAIQWPEGQRDIELTLQQLDRLWDRPDSISPVGLWPDCRSDMEKRIAAALERTIRLDFDDTPLNDACRILGERFAIPVEIDNKALEDVGIGVDVPVTIHAGDVTLEAGLRLMLRDLELTFHVRADVLLITTPDSGCGPTTVVFPVNDLVGPGDGDEGHRFIELVTTVVYPTAWDFTGGPCTAELLDNRFLFVSADDDILPEVEAFFQELRQALSAGSSCLDFIGVSPATRRIESALQQTVSLEFEEARLSDIVQWVRNKWSINVELDGHHIDDPAVQIDTPITCGIQDAALEDGLRKMLAPRGTDVIVRDDVLWFVHPADRTWERTRRFYNVRAIVDPDFGLLDQLALMEVIQRAIGSHVRDNTYAFWDDAIIYRGVLIVSETRDNQKAVARIVAHLTSHSKRLRRELRSACLPREALIERLLEKIHAHVALPAGSRLNELEGPS